MVRQRAGRAILSVLLPLKCHVCGRPAVAVTTGTGADRRPPRSGLRPKVDEILSRHLCHDCAQTFMAVESPMCECCGKMFVSRQGGNHLCGECLRQPRFFSRARSAWVFDRCLATLVHKLKYNGRIGLAKPLGIFMLAVLLDNWNLDEIDCVVPVPLHRKRMSRRGFNQSYMLSKFWPAMVGPGIAVDPTVLIRVRQTASQTGLGRRERAANLKNAFRINPGKEVADLRLLLVDDVFTTGATVNECSKILLKGGASRVDVLTLARTG